MQSIDIVVKSEEANMRLDKLLCRYLADYTRSAVQKLIEQGAIKVNGILEEKNYKVKNQDIISVDIPPISDLDVKSENIPLDIRYEDGDLLVVNKPQGMVVHPAPGNSTGTLVNALLHYCKDTLSGINGVSRPGIVHRIDKNTSGLLIVAKNDFAHRILAEQIKEHSFKREYEAIVEGTIKDEKGTLDFPIGRHPKDRKKMAVTYKNSKNAITHFEVLERYEGFTRLKLTLETGRTHQIRVHMSHICHPVSGDEVYGSKNKLGNLKGQCLHAKTIGFSHPRNGKYVEIVSELPKYFINLINLLKLK